MCQKNKNVFALMKIFPIFSEILVIYTEGVKIFHAKHVFELFLQLFYL